MKKLPNPDLSDKAQSLLKEFDLLDSKEIALLEEKVKLLGQFIESNSTNFKHVNLILDGALDTGLQMPYNFSGRRRIYYASGKFYLEIPPKYEDDITTYRNLRIEELRQLLFDKHFIIYVLSFGKYNPLGDIISFS